MIYKEYINAGGTGIITLLYQNQALKFLTADIVTSLDRDYTRKNGLKVFADDVEEELTNNKDLTNIAMELKSIYSDLWNTLYQAQPETLSTSKTEVADNGSIDTKNTIAGYDSDDMVNDNATNQTNNNNTTTTKTDYETLGNVMEQLQNNNVWGKIKSDLNIYLFTTIYN